MKSKQKLVIFTVFIILAAIVSWLWFANSSIEIAPTPKPKPSSTSDSAFQDELDQAQLAEA
jgi:type II secretory pathway component PulC